MHTYCSMPQKLDTLLCSFLKLWRSTCTWLSYIIYKCMYVGRQLWYYYSMLLCTFPVYLHVRLSWKTTIPFTQKGSKEVTIMIIWLFYSHSHYGLHWQILLNCFVWESKHTQDSLESHPTSTIRQLQISLWWTLTSWIPTSCIYNYVVHDTQAAMHMVKFQSTCIHHVWSGLPKLINTLSSLITDS